MDDFTNSVMIALLPTTFDWCKIDLPHLTLVFAGEVTDHPDTDFNVMAKDACTIAMLSSRVRVRVLGPEVFGDEDKVDVLRLETTPELLAMRSIVEHWNASEYPFRPHVTVGPVGTITTKEIPLPNYSTPRDTAEHIAFPVRHDDDEEYDTPTKTQYYVEDSLCPNILCFDKVMVGWGDQRLTFNFKSY